MGRIVTRMHVACNPVLPAELTPFEDGSMGLYSVVVYRFADLPAKGQLIPRTPPMAIGTLYE